MRAGEDDVVVMRVGEDEVVVMRVSEIGGDEGR